MATARSTFPVWCQNNLSDLLGFPVGEEMVNYVLAFESAREIKEHFSNLLPMDTPEAQKFHKEFFNRWKPPTSSGTVIQKKFNSLDDFMKPKTEKKKSDIKNNTKQKDNKQQQPKLLQNFAGSESAEYGEDPNVMSVDVRGAEFLDKNKPMIGELQMKTCSPFKKKNLKFVPLFSADGKMKTDTITIPGRHPCQCLAQKHKLVNNCSSCGRIVCVQEGAGPCMFCGELVCSPEDQEVINRESKQGRKLRDKLLNQEVPRDAVLKENKEDAGLNKALEHKNRLLQYDKNFTKRTKVIDDESDYFSADNRWLSSKQRDQVKKRDQEKRDKRFASRLDRKFTIDFAGRRVVESQEENFSYIDEDIQTPIESLNGGGITDAGKVDFNVTVDPRINVKPPIFNPIVIMESDDQPTKHRVPIKKVTKKNRLQDDGIQHIADQGMCMSMHQPWASLLVHGVKKLEGRSWYTSHRGRLWIASTAQQTEKDVIDNVVEDYKRMYPEIPDSDYPEDYPSAALLGCVNVVDCATNEEYFEKNPDCNEENGSAFLFVCDNAEQLKIKFQLSGKHKIYKLDSHIHDGAKKNLQYSMK